MVFLEDSVVLVLQLVCCIVIVFYSGFCSNFLTEGCDQ